MTNPTKTYDLMERTGRFGENIIRLCRALVKNNETVIITKQLTRSATSIGANYMEANAPSSRKDFRNKILICKKESQETMHWIRMLAASTGNPSADLKKLWQEAHELTMIFQTITNTLYKSDE